MRFDLDKLLQKRERTADGVPFSSWDVIAGTVRQVRATAPDGSIQFEYRRWQPTKRLRRIMAGDGAACGAMTRSGQPCRAHVVPGRRRCRLHGGMSTGPRTPEGRAAIAKSNRRRARLKTGYENGYSQKTFRSIARRVNPETRHFD
jgi:hypothetical protein